MQCIYFLAAAICQLIQLVTGFKRYGKKCNPLNDVLNLHKNNSDRAKDSSQFDLEICTKEDQSDQDHVKPNRQTTKVDVLIGSRMVNRAVLTHDALYPIRKHHEQVETYNSFINDTTVAAIQQSSNDRTKEGITTIRILVDEIRNEVEENERKNKLRLEKIEENERKNTLRFESIERYLQNH